MTIASAWNWFAKVQLVLVAVYDCSTVLEIKSTTIKQFLDSGSLSFTRSRT